MIDFHTEGVSCHVALGTGCIANLKFGFKKLRQHFSDEREKELVVEYLDGYAKMCYGLTTKKSNVYILSNHKCHCCTAKLVQIWSSFC